MTIAARTGVDRADLILRRALASILCLLAALCALPAVLGAFMFLSGGRWGDLGMGAVTGLVATMLGWLGRLLWMGRPIPGWFIFGCVALPGAVFLIWGMALGRWFETIFLAGLWLPAAESTWSYWSAMRRAVPGKPSGPKGVDDFA